MTIPETVPAWPRIEAVARENGTGEVILNGNSQPVSAGNLDEVRVEIVRTVTDIARSLGRPVRVSTSGPDGHWPLIVHPNGAVTADEDDQPRPGRRAAVERPAAEDLVSMNAPTIVDQPGPARPPLDEGADAAVHDQDAGDHGPRTGMPGSQEHAGDTPLHGETGPWPDQPAPGPSPIPAAPPATGSYPQPTPRTFGQPPVGQPPVGQPPVGPAQGGHLPVGQPPAGQPRGRAAAAQYQPQRSAEPIEQTVPQQRQSFLTREQTDEPATRGFRGFLGKVGIRMSPNESERAERADVQAVSQHWPGPRTIAVVNGKGGAGKSPSTVLLSAVFALFGGAGVVAWDNNQTRGTLGWRTEQGPHESTLHDLLPEIPRLLGTGAQSADLAHYVHHQSRDRFDVLRSQPMVLANLQRLEPKDVDAIHSVLGKYYRLIFIDSGNDESDPMWLRMIDHADQLVVATTTRDDHAEAGALLLEALAERDERSAALARSSVAIVSQADPSARPADLKRVAAGYQALTRATVTVPFDPAMVDGLLRYGLLKPETKRAWLAAAAAVARGL